MHIDFNAFLDSFYVMGMGMAGIFIVIVVLMLVLKGLTLLFPEREASLASRFCFFGMVFS